MFLKLCYIYKKKYPLHKRLQKDLMEVKIISENKGDKRVQGQSFIFDTTISQECKNMVLSNLTPCMIKSSSLICRTIGLGPGITYQNPNKDKCH